MVLDGSKRDPQNELTRTMEQLIARQKTIDKRVERLETLEADFSRFGCVFWEEYDSDPGAATLTVEFDPQITREGNFVGCQATIFWRFSCDSQNSMELLHMRINAIAANDYNYAYKFTRAGALTQGNADAQTSFVVGRIRGNSQHSSLGVLHIPFYPFVGNQVAMGDWTAYDSTQPANQKQEKGEWGGLMLGTVATRSQSFTFFPAAGNFSTAQAFLYGWCPGLTPLGVPAD